MSTEQIRQDIRYYLWSTYRRKVLDDLLEEHRHYYKGVVLDIGGRKRGKFKQPKKNISKWIFADIVAEHNPDIILDVCNMSDIKDKSIDVINAIELFEHVSDPEKGLQECYRVLRDDGLFILSVPFLFPIHADPYDFQRWTDIKWKEVLRTNKFEIEKLIPMGGFFMVLMEMIKRLVKELPRSLKYVSALTFPIMDAIQSLDNKESIKNNKVFSKYTSGYFIIVKKDQILSSDQILTNH